MKIRFTLFLILLNFIAYSQLSAGDIAFVQYNADGTDDFGFVCLTDIPANEVIKFTDNEENDLSGGEGTITWTAPNTGVSCGTVITITTTPSASLGTVTETNNLIFSTSGDGIIAYQGNANNPTYITALGNDGPTAGVYSGSKEGNLPSGLTLGVNAQSIAEIDNAIYNGAVLNDTQANILSAIYDFNNWTGSNSANQTFSGNFTVTDCVTTPCTEPTTDATFHANSPQNITTNSVTLNWTNGDGANRIVVMSTNPITFNPVDGTTYPANSGFGNGTAVAANTYVVYNGNANTVDITNLTPGTFYYTKIFEYNCTIGNEDYLTTGTTATDSFYVKPEKPTSFSKVCSTNTSIDLEWTAPTNGNYDGFLLVVRQGATPHSVNSFDPSTIANANTDFSLAGTYGSTLPNSRFLYVGTGTNATISNLTQGVSYTFKLFAFSDNGIAYTYSNGKTLNRTIGLDEVINPNIIGANAQATVNWTNIDNACFDEVLVVVNETAGIDFSPSGDGSSYSPNTNYTSPNQVVYLGNGNTVTVTNFTNGTTYYFEIFVRNGTSWSNGIELSIIPNTQTTFKAGDMVIVGYDNKINANGDDVVTILTFVDIQPNTTFWYANATYEVGAPANVRTKQWKSCTTTPNASIGAQQFTYLGPNVLPSGSTFCITIDNNQVLATDFNVHNSSGSGTYNFSDGFIPIGFSNNINISTTKPDSIFLMQGSWSADLGGYRNFNGVVLGGIQDGGNWYTISDDLSNLSGVANRISRIPPDIQCFAIQGTTISGKGFAYYNGSKNDTHINLLGFIADFTNNWTQGVGTDGNEISGTSCDNTYTFTISGTATPGIWTNAKNDNNWFNCGNWENLTVPNENVDVQINTLSGNDEAIIDYNAPDADVYNGIASCKNLSIAGEKVVAEGNANNILAVYGNLNIANGILDMDDGNTATTDGILSVYGNWNNTSEANFLQGNGKVIFTGNTNQIISCNSGTETEKFYNLTINNPLGVTFASGNIHSEGDLRISNSNSPITVNANHYILAGNSLLNDNNTKFIVSNEGEFIQTKTGADTNTGSDNTTFQVKKTTTPYVMYDYNYWSSPIKSANINTVFSANNPNFIFEFVTQNFYDDFGGNGYPQTTGTADSHDDNGDDWAVASGIMTNGKGYAIMGEGAVFPFTPPTATTFTQNVNFTGNINNGIINIDVYKDKYNTDKGFGNSFNKNDNLVGNPYPSTIDANVFLTENPNLGGTIYFWTHDTEIGGGANVGPDAYNFTNDDYASWNSLGGTAAHLGSPTPTNEIPSGKGFMVTATVNETIHFDNSMRIIPASNVGGNRTNRIWLNLTNNEGLFRQILIGFDENATDGEDRLFDGLRIENGNGYDFYSLLGDKKMGIQGLAPFQTEKIIPLGMENIQNGTFTISIDHFESDYENTSIYLKDNLLNILHDLKLANYIFNEDRLGNLNNRFELVFQKNALSIGEQTNSDNLIITNLSDNLFTIINRESLPFKSIIIYDITGKVIYKTSKYHNASMQIKLNIANGVYICKAVLENNKTYSQKFIKNK